MSSQVHGYKSCQALLCNGCNALLLPLMDLMCVQLPLSSGPAGIQAPSQSMHRMTTRSLQDRTMPEVLPHDLL